MKNRLILALALIIISHIAKTQSWSFGPKLGLSISPTSTIFQGISDSTNLSGNNALNGIPIYGIFINKELNKIISLHSEINYFASFTSYKLEHKYGKDQFNLPITRVSHVPHNTIEIKLEGTIILPFSIPKIKLGISGGITTHLYFNPYDDPPQARYFAEETGAIQQIWQSAKPLKAAPTYGVFVLFYDRLECFVSYTEINNYINDVTYQNDVYILNSRAEYLFLSLGYRFNSFKLHKEKK